MRSKARCWRFPASPSRRSACATNASSDRRRVAAAIVAQAVLERGLPKFTLLNINTPKGPNKGFRVTVQAKRNHVTTVSERMDPRHKPYYWIEEGENEWEPHDRSDYQAVRDGYISITPLQPDMTAYDALAFVEGLTLANRTA